MMKIKTCPVCWSQFQYKSNKARFDTDACRKVAARLREKQRRAKFDERTCSKCGDHFRTTVPIQIYCGRRCAKRADNANQRRRRAEEATLEVIRSREAGPSLKTPKSETAVSNTQEQALYDEEATRRAQVVRDEQPGFDPQDLFTDDPTFLRRSRGY